jgi:hypothetical protein
METLLLILIFAIIFPPLAIFILVCYGIYYGVIGFFVLKTLIESRTKKLVE